MSKGALARVPNPKSKAIVDVHIEPDTDKPVIGITYLDITNNNYGFKGFHKTAQGIHDRNLYDEFGAFVRDAAKQKSISDVVTKYCSSFSLKNKDDKSIRLLQKIKKEYDVDATDIVHLHCKPGGSGKFVLHGFILRNVFEIVMIDPNHEVHKSK